VANLAKLRATNLKNAQGNSLKASEKRQQAAQAKVKSARFNLEAKKALSQAAVQRGTESSRIRGSLSQPALQLPNLAENSTNRFRISYTEKLQYALVSYRELLRFYRSAGANDIPILDRDSTWSGALEKWAEEARTMFNTSIDQDDPQIVEWDLTPEQIAALLSPEGFRVFFASEITEALPLFTVNNELEHYLQKNDLLSSPWKREFARVGINLSNQVSAQLDEGGNWKIIDKRTTPIRVTSYARNLELVDYWNIKPVRSWNIQSEALTYTAMNTLTVTRQHEPFTGALPLFTVNRELESYLQEGKLLNSPWKKEFARVGINLSNRASTNLDEVGNWRIIDEQEGLTCTVMNTLTVTRRQEPPAAGRSPLPNQYWEQIAPEAARTGRLIGVFLDASIEGTDQKISETDYQIEVKYLNDFRFDRKQVKLLRTSKPLRRGRTVFLQKDISPATALENISKLSKDEGEPHPYAVQGTPLSGTTLIRLFALGVKQFNKIKIRLLYKYYAPAG
jgi:hypothetical protein